MPYTFEYIPGLFALTTWEQDIDRRFGLTTPDWKTFAATIEGLQAEAAEGEQIKVIYTARHGEAEHNVLAAKYGEPENVVQRNHPITDPRLTEEGRVQAVRLADAFAREAKAGMPLPTRFFVSPMRRPGETCGLEWGWLFGGTSTRDGDWGARVPARVVEEIREHLHVHHCDERLSVSELKQLFPSFHWPESMPDRDTVWKPGSVRGRETEEEMVARAGRGLSIIMDESFGDTYISMTAHSGVLRAVFKNLHVPLHRLATGEMNVLVVRVRTCYEQ